MSGRRVTRSCAEVQSPRNETLEEERQETDQCLTRFAKIFEANWSTYKACSEKRRILNEVTQMRNTAAVTLSDARSRVELLESDLIKAKSNAASALTVFESSDNDTRLAKTSLQETQAAADQHFAVKEEEYKKHLEKMKEEQKIQKNRLLEYEAFANTLSFEENVCPPQSS